MVRKREGDSIVQRMRALDWQRWALHAAALLPAIWILAGYARNDLTANPLQAVEQRTGRTALTFLLLALACTPANFLLGWRSALRHRRTLGLYAFVYAAVHLMILVGLDYGFAFRLLRADLQGKPFIWVGAAALMILTALAATSFPVWKRRLGKNWKRLHRLAYLAVLLVVVHFAWARKGNLAALSGDILLPLAYGTIAVMLLTLRIRVIRRWLSRRKSSAAAEPGTRAESRRPVSTG